MEEIIACFAFVFSYLYLLHTSLPAVNPKTLAPLDIQLEMDANTTILKASVLNADWRPLRAFNIGTFLHREAPVQKVQVYAGDDPAEFIGIRCDANVENLDKTCFTVLLGKHRGPSILEFDIADLYDLSAGGQFRVSMSGFLPLGNTQHELIGDVKYQSNELLFVVKAAKSGPRQAELPKVERCLVSRG